MPKNGSLKLKNISSGDRKQYTLSLDTPQPFSRGSLCIWRPWKHRDKGACLILILIYHTTWRYWNSHCDKKRFVIFEKYFVSRWKTILPFICYPAAIPPRQIGYMAFVKTSILECILAQSCQRIPIWQELSQRHIAEKRLVKTEKYFVSRYKTILPFIWYPAAIQPRQIVHMALLETSILGCILARPCQHSPKWQAFS